MLVNEIKVMKTERKLRNRRLQGPWFVYIFGALPLCYARYRVVYTLQLQESSITVRYRSRSLGLRTVEHL